MKNLIKLLLIVQSLNGSASGFVSVEGDNFYLDGYKFFPRVINYGVTLTKNYNNGAYYLSPFWNYSMKWGTPNTGGSGRYYYSSTNDIGVSIAKLSRDMKEIKKMGFNTLRIFGISPTFEDGKLSIPTGSYASYFSLIKQLLDTLDHYGLKAILLIDASFEYHDEYRQYLEKVGAYFKENNTIMAYDLFNEPFWAFTKIDANDKYLFANWTADWYYSLKKNAPNQLITIGATRPESVINADPGVLTVDFISFHLYAWTKDMQITKNRISNYLKWISEVINKPWIISETGYSGTNINIDHFEVGTEAQQKEFADFYLQRAEDCGCSGVGWWQYSEMSHINPYEDYLGLITHFPEEKEKLASVSFTNNYGYQINKSNCVQSVSMYYNVDNYSNYELRGYVKDENGVPINNAVIVGWKWALNGTFFVTYSRSNGYFVLYTDRKGISVDDLWISANGYSTYRQYSPALSANYSLTKIDDNQWQKRLTNNNNGKIDNWVLSVSDKYYCGDFDGDGADELLCVNTAINGLISMYDYSTGSFKLKWSNNGNTSIGAYIYNYKNNLTVGDYDGDGADELLGASTANLRVFEFKNDNWLGLWTGSNSSILWPYQDNFISGDFNGDGKDEILANDVDGKGWITLFGFSNSDWIWIWSNIGNNHAIISYRDNLISGDFNGDGKDEILGNDIDGNGWITLFSFYNNDWNWIWSNNGNDNGMLPYRKKFLVGNFDNDKGDEILGIKDWATKFDFYDGEFNWTWSTYDAYKIVDYQINVGDIQFLIKPYKNVPAYLFTKHGNAINMYGMSNLIENGSFLKSVKIDDISNIGEDSMLNISDFSNEVVIYPNPAKNYIKINSINENIIDNKIIICDICGKQVKSTTISGKLTEVDISELPTGIYLIKLQFSDNTICKKIIKE